MVSVRDRPYYGRTLVRTNRGTATSLCSFTARREPGRLAGGTSVTGREILEEVVALLGEVPEGDEAEELCVKLRVWLSARMPTSHYPSAERQPPRSPAD